MSTAQRFIPLPPCRVADTRDPNGPFGGPVLPAGSTRTWAIAGRCGVPSGAAAFSLNVTVVPQGPLGYLTVYPAGETQPLASTLNSLDGRVKANAAIVPGSNTGSVSVFVTNATHVVLDVNGYFVPASAPDSLAFFTIQPCRLADTRSASGVAGGGALNAGESRDIPVLNGSCGVPSDARAYSLNITAVPAQALGFVTTWAAGTPRPLASTLNALTGAITANAALVPAGTSGAISLYATDRTDLVIDINGYFAPMRAGGLDFYAATPCRILDTRNAAGPFGGPALTAPAERTFTIPNSSCAVPDSARAYSINATVVPAGSLGYLTLWPAGTARPTVSTLNSLDGSVAANAALLPANSGNISAFAAGITHLVLDINGFFSNGDANPPVTPLISELAPTAAVTGWTDLTIDLTGRGTQWRQGTTQVSFGSDVPVKSVTVASPTSLRAVVSTQGNLPPGARAVTVRTGAATELLPNGFRILPSPAPVRLAQSATPAVAAAGDAVQIGGSGFPATALDASKITIVLLPATPGAAPPISVNASAVTPNSGGSRTVAFTLPQPISLQQPTAYLVTMSGPGDAPFFSSNAATLVITPNRQAPMLVSLNPSTARRGELVRVTVTGSGTAFTQASSGVAFPTEAHIQAASVNVASATSLSATLSIGSDAPLRSHDVHVTTGQQTLRLAAALTVLPATQSAPKLLSVVPASGAVGTAVTVTITGQNTEFGPGTTIAADGVSATNVQVLSPTSLRATLVISSAAALGPRAVTTTTGPQALRLGNAFLVTGPSVTISSPRTPAFVNTPSITVSGSTSDPGASVSVNDVAAGGMNGSFTVGVPLSEGTNTVTAVARSASGATASTSVVVTLDTTPPRIAILSPPDGFETADASIAVTGNVNDIVTGTVNDEEVQVTVNGVGAQVRNRTFSVVVPLQAGTNALQVVARDRVGNSATATSTVTRSTASRLRVVSGNRQSGTAGSPLAQPIVVAVSNENGTPAVNRQVVFRVAGGDGVIRQSTTEPGRAAVIGATDAQGQARVFWTLGTRAGAGHNLLEATSPNSPGGVQFSALSQAAAAARIVVDSGQNQTGATGDLLPFPFIAIVTDEAHNRLSGVPVTFRVRQGGGSLDGQTTVTVTSDPSGRAAVVLRLGSQEHNVVEAAFPGNPGMPATFSANAKVPRPGQQTKVTGVVLDNSNIPLRGVTMRLLRLNSASNSNLPVQVGTSVETDAQGQFSLTGMSAGVFKLMADGTTVTGRSLPTLEFDMTVITGETNTLGMPIYLPVLDTENKLCVTGSTGGTLTLPSVPGFSLTVAPGAATFPGGSKSGCISVTPVNMDKIPMTPGFGQQPRFVVTIQPVGATFNPPAAITIPNVDGLKPRQSTELYSYDHDLASFISIGTGTVSNDGMLIRSDPGVGVSKAGWHCGGDPAQPASTGLIRLSLSQTETVRLEPRKELRRIKVTAFGGPPLDGHYEWKLIKKGETSLMPAKFVESDSSEWLNACSNSEEGKCEATLEALSTGAATLEVAFVCRRTNERVVQTLRVMTDDLLLVHFQGGGYLSGAEPDLSNVVRSDAFRGGVVVVVGGDVPAAQIAAARTFIDANEWDDARNTYVILVGYSAGGYPAVTTNIRARRVISLDPINYELARFGDFDQSDLTYTSPNTDVWNFYQRNGGFGALLGFRVANGLNFDATAFGNHGGLFTAITAAGGLQCLIGDALGGPCRLSNIQPDPR